MGRKTSVYLTDDLDRALRLDGRPVAEILRAGLTGTPAKRPRTPATRIPDDFTVTSDMVTWARREVPAVDGRRETENFIDYWRSASGANARKLDWTAAWRNWMRKADPGGSGTLKSREQRERDAMFERAFARAEEKDKNLEVERSRAAGEVRRRALPSAEG